MAIEHPFHPFRNQRFRIMTTGRVDKSKTLILEGTDRGAFTVLREWTDQADPPEAVEREANPTTLRIPALLELAAFVESLAERPASPKR